MYSKCPLFCKVSLGGRKAKKEKALTEVSLTKNIKAGDVFEACRGTLNQK